MFRLQVGSWAGKTGIIVDVGDFGDGEHERGVYSLNQLDLMVLWENGKVVPCASKDLVCVNGEG